ncbi:MAG: TIGR03986 family CRISPR-associated RAMP protein [Armatimonadetes bacterium]|nr:TIGR03986 family CRISPR-associated RAMP protein [Armatimonadota bacterium]
MAANEFLPPYNFVPLSDAPAREQWDDLLNRAGHERFTGLCGRITCEIKTLTPLFIPDAEGQCAWPATKDTHREKRFFRVNGVPAIPPATLKGAIRSVYETLTGSCLGVYDQESHKTRMGWRRAANHPRRDPARLYREGQQVKYGVYTGQARIPFEAVALLGLSDGAPLRSVTTIKLRNHGPVEAIAATAPSGAAWSAYSPVVSIAGNFEQRGSKWHVRAGADCYRLPDTLKAMLPIAIAAGASVTLRRVLHTISDSPGINGVGPTPTSYNGMARSYKRYAIAVDYAGNSYALPTPIATSPDMVAHITSSGDANKSNDRVFWGLTNPVDVSGDDYDACVGAHKTCDPKLADAHLHGWGAMLKDEGDVAPQDGPLVYVASQRYRGVGFRPPQAVFIGPVAMYREPYDKTVDDCTSGEHKPGACNKTDGLCPACALFGGLFPKEQSAKKSDVPLAGRVSINTAWFLEAPDSVMDFRKVPLRILGEPRPSYFPFYLRPNGLRAVDYNGVPWQEPQQQGKPSRPEDPDEWPPAQDGLRIRGRKFYWHNPARWETSQGATDGDWTKEYRIQDEHFEAGDEFSESGRTNQNATVELLKPGARFKFTVDFENLSENELKLLLWCLNLETGMAHHLGMGKPIGLGSAEVKVQEVVVRDLKTSYTDLLAEDEKQWGAFDRDNPAALLNGVPHAGTGILKQLKKILTVNPFGQSQPRIDYIPDVLPANEGFKYYTHHRHNPLKTIPDAVGGARMVANNLPHGGN